MLPSQGCCEECTWSRCHFENREGLQKCKRSLLSPYENTTPSSFLRTIAPNTRNGGLWFTVFLFIVRLERFHGFFVIVNIYFTGVAQDLLTSLWRLCSNIDLWIGQQMTHFFQGNLHLSLQSLNVLLNTESVPQRSLCVVLRIKSISFCQS